MSRSSLQANALFGAMQNLGADAEGAPAEAPKSNVFGGRRWKRASGAAPGEDAKESGNKSLFGGRWKKNASGSASSPRDAPKQQLAVIEPDAPRDSPRKGAGWRRGPNNKDADAFMPKADEPPQSPAAVQSMASVLDKMEVPGTQSAAAHPLEGKGSREVFKQMSGVQKKALEILGQEAFEGITESWMAVLGGHTQGGDSKDGFSQPPNPLVPTGIIGKRLRQVSGGLNHLVVCGDAGEVMAVGENKYGQLGVSDKSEAAGMEKAVTQLTTMFGNKELPEEEDQSALAQEAPSSELFCTPVPIKGALYGRRAYHVSCGSSFTACITDAGEVFTWGNNEFGQLGHGDKLRRNTPAVIESLQFTAHRAGVVIVDLDCGADHVAAISFSKELWSWGLGNFGNLGHGTSFSYSEPRVVEAVQKSDIQQVSCGTRHSLAINKVGEVLSWGFGGDGRLGHGDTSGFATPKVLELLKGKTGLDRMISVSAGDSHSAALSDRGELFSWGSGSYYKLGHGDITDRQAPRVVKQLMGKVLVDVSCGFYHTAALTDNGVLYTWGGGIYGKLGHPTTDNVGYPTPVKALSGKRIAAVVCTAISTVVVSETGDLLTCGYGSKGALGHGEQTHEEQPKRVESLRGSRIAMYAVLQDEMRARAAQQAGGKTKAQAASDSAVQAPDMERSGSQIQTVAVGQMHTAAVSEEGQVFVWGNGKDNRLGLGDDCDITTPRKVMGVLERKLITMVGCGEKHTVAITGDGNEVFVWGSEGDGRLGLGMPDMIDPDMPPAEYAFPEQLKALDGQRVTELAVGAAHNLVATENKDVYAWGAGSHGRLGLGSTSDVWEPKKCPMEGSHPIKKLAAGAKHSMLIRAVPATIGSGTNNEVLSWGSGWWYRLGHGDQDNQLLPKEIKELSGKLIVEISCGTAHSAAVSSTGDVYTWGYGGNGRLGHDDYHNQEEPRLVKTLRGVDRKVIVKIACGDAHTAAVSDDGKMVVWGKGKYGQLGTGDTNECQRPITLAWAGTKVSQVVCGANHTVVLTSSKEPHAWGMGGSGRLGHGDLSDCLQPKAIETLKPKKGAAGFFTGGTSEELFEKQNQQESTVTDRITVLALQQMLKAESPDTEDLVKQDQDRLRGLLHQSEVEKHNNAVLEREIRQLDKKIKMLVKNKKDVQNRLRKNLLSSQSSPISTLREDYENLFYLLQNQPRYLALLTGAVPEEADAIVRAFTALYGNQTDPREEHLMLEFFTQAMADEFKKADRIQVVLGGSSSIVQTMNAYLRRESNREQLVAILGPPMSNVVNNTNPFELNPIKVYHQVCLANNGIPDAAATTMQVLRDPEVLEGLTLRTQMLRDFTKTFLDAVINSLDTIPYGIRWLCKQIYVQANACFEGAEHATKMAQVGALLLLHWFNPAICFPESVRLVDSEVNPELRQHLVLITKVLHNIVHGTTFTDSEKYMSYINDFITSSTQRLHSFLEELMDVEPLAEHNQNVQYGATLKNEPAVIRIFTNDIFRTHKLLYQCLASVAPTLDDPIRVVLKDLGAPPADMEPDKNKGVELKLISRFDQPPKDDSDGAQSLAALMQETRWQLMRVLRLIQPVHITARKYSCDPEVLTSLLSKAKQDAIQGEDYMLAEKIKELQARMHELALRGLYNQSQLLQDSALEILNRAPANAKISQEQFTLQASIDASRARRIYLLTSISAFRETLSNARATAFSPPQVQLGLFDRINNHGTLQRDRMVGPFRYSFVELERDGVVLKSDFPEQFRAHLVFLFSSSTPGIVQVAVVAKQQAGPGLGSRDTYLFDAKVILEELLMAKEKKHTEVDLHEVVFELNGLVEILNHHFFE